MQVSTVAAYFSVVLAGTLLVGPFAVLHAVKNSVAAGQSTSQVDREFTRESVLERDQRCELALRTFRDRAVRQTVSPNLPSAPAGIAATHRPPAGQLPAAQHSTAQASPSLVLAQYEAATQEIRQRISQEEVLFGLKFTLIGAILGVLFNLSKKDSRWRFEEFVQKRRTAVFFAVALLVSAIIDTRLRFNARIIESLGDWIWCVERSVSAPAPESVPFGSIYWEHFLHLRLDAGPFPLMRNFFYLLTALLYGATLYLFISMPRVVSRSSMTMLTNTGAVFFGLLTVVGVSYDCPWGGGDSLDNPLTTLALAVLGWLSLRIAYRSRYSALNIVTMTESALEAGAVDESQRPEIEGCLLKVKRLHFPKRFVADLMQLEVTQGGRVAPGADARTSGDERQARWSEVLVRSGVAHGVMLNSALRLLAVMADFHPVARLCLPPLLLLLGLYKSRSGERAEDALWRLYFADEERRAESSLRNPPGAEPASAR